MLDYNYATGGRGGSSYGQSKALDDVWRFTVASRSWTQLTTSGRAPLPRFLFGYDAMYPVLHQSNAHEQALHSGNNLATEPESVVEGSGKNSSQLSASDRRSAPDGEAASFMIPESGEHDEVLSSMLSDRTLAKPAAYERTYLEPVRPKQNQLADATSRLGGQSNGPAGSMIVFGGESNKECYLDDVWVLHLNSLMWQELSRPVACQKRCRSMLEQN